MKILITGGCGYIGHYAVKELIKKGHDIIVVDDLSTGYAEGINEKSLFYKIDIRNYKELNKVFKENKIDLVMDFAARLIVEDSNINPKEYYDVNVNGLKVILDLMVEYNVKNIIFSSTAAVHGLLDKGDTLINEEDITIPSNPYGETKLVGEKMIQWYSKAYDINYIIFRYFNVVGGIKPGASVDEFTTIIPRIISSISKGNTLKVFGDNYPTHDGTCIRDYIHVYDLINAHTLVVESIRRIEPGIYNLSIGKGTTVLELIKKTEESLNKKINYKIVDRREGDPVISAASNEKIMKVINWDIKYQKIEDMVKEAYNSWVK